MVLDDRVKRDVQKAFLLLAQANKVPVKESDLPDVVVKKGDANYYSPQNKTIVISPQGVGDGEIYFEEASHALRDLVMRRRGVSSDRQDQQVQEFYGRAGGIIGRRITRGTELQRLYDGKPIFDMNDPEVKKGWFNRLQRIRKDKAKLREVRRLLSETRSRIKEGTHQNYAILQGVIDRYQHGEIDTATFRKAVDVLRENYHGVAEWAKKNGGIESLRMMASGIKMYDSNLAHLQEVGRIASGAEAKEQRELMLRGINFLNEGGMIKKFDEFVDIETADVFTADLNNQLYSHQHHTHRKPYVFAQQNSAEYYLTTENFYAIPDKEVRKRFFHRKKSGLEKKVDMISVLALVGVISWYVGRASVNGFVVGETITSNNLGFFLIFVSAIILTKGLASFIGHLRRAKDLNNFYD